MLRLSIITPVYRGEAFIEGCLQTVIDQHCVGVEHIVVDAASPDRTIDIVKAYAVRYPHIRWISEKDKGQSDAMNKGISLARAPVIGFLNVDDFYEPGAINRALKILQTLPEPSLAVGNCNIWNESGELLKVNRPRRLALTDLLMGWNINPIPANPTAYLYHKSLHEEIGLYPVDEHFALDLDFMLRAVQAARKVSYVDEIWGNFRYLPGTKTFEDCQGDGESGKRADRVLQHYREKLSLLQRVELAFKEGRHRIRGVVGSRTRAILKGLVPGRAGTPDAKRPTRSGNP